MEPWKTLVGRTFERKTLMNEPFKGSGLGTLISLPLGSHICHFYRGKQELFEPIVPYFRTGLLNNERCIMVCSEPLEKDEALDFLRTELPELGHLLNAEQIKVFLYDEWYYNENQEFDTYATLRRWQTELSSAIAAGYSGLRIAGNLSRLTFLQQVLEYEDLFCGISTFSPIVAMCAYPLENLHINDVIEIANVHQFALLRNDSGWKLTKSARYRDVMWQSLLDGLSQGMVATDDSGTILTASNVCLGFLGCTTLSDLGPNIQEFARRFKIRSITGKIPPAAILSIDTDTHTEDYWKATSRIHGDVELLVSIRRSKSNPVIPGLFLMVFHDLTGLRKLESVKNEFLQIMSHELRNPVQTIKALLNLIGSSISSDNTSLVKYMQLADTCINQITTLIKDLLAIRAFEGERNTVNAIPTEFRALLQETLVPYMENHEHNIICLFDDKTVVPMVVDPMRIRQILTNILNNAMKYTPKGKRIWLDITLSGDSAILTIEDEGIGIPEDEIERVFDQFYRASNAHGYSSGIGLGLYVSRCLARMHGGDLWAERRDKGGTAVMLSLPVLKNGALDNDQSVARNTAIADD